MLSPSLLFLWMVCFVYQNKSLSLPNKVHVFLNVHSLCRIPSRTPHDCLAFQALSTSILGTLLHIPEMALGSENVYPTAVAPPSPIDLRYQQNLVGDHPCHLRVSLPPPDADAAASGDRQVSDEAEHHSVLDQQVSDEAEHHTLGSHSGMLSLQVVYLGHKRKEAFWAALGVKCLSPSSYVLFLRSEVSAQHTSAKPKTLREALGQVGVQVPAAKEVGSMGGLILCSDPDHPRGSTRCYSSCFMRQGHSLKPGTY